MRSHALVAVLCLFALPAFADIWVDLPIVTHAVGATTTFYTSIDITNNTAQSTGLVTFEYISSDLAVDAKGTLLTTLGPHGNFHSDDILGFLASNGFITSAQATNGFGTMMMRFRNATFTIGTEAQAVVRVYNYVTPGQRPSVGLAYRGAVVYSQHSHTLFSVISNTTAVTDGTPAVVTNLGLENFGYDETGIASTTPVTVQLTFYDPRTGNQVGPQPTVTLSLGQVTQLNDLWSRYSLPLDATQLVVSATPIAGTAQIHGYVVLKDVATNDGSFFSMQ